jgi:hypothetical protein
VKLFLALLSSLAVTGILSGSTDDGLPLPFNFDRYTPMLNHSPFAVGATAAVPEPTPDFARDLYIANAARSPEADMVTIRSSSDQNFKKYLTTREPIDGYSIAQIEWSEDVGKTKVTISKDGKFATLTFDQALLSQAASAGRPTVNQMPARMPNIPPRRAGPASRDDADGIIERNPKIVSAPISNAAAEPELGSDAARDVPAPPRGIALPKPLAGSQAPSGKAPAQ